jgi:dTDP-4-amino-4,6-dideoxygalactose transaminase
MFKEEYPDPKNTFPIATKTTGDTFFLGVYPGITDEQMNYIRGVVNEFMSRYENGNVPTSTVKIIG